MNHIDVATGDLLLYCRPFGSGEGEVNRLHANFLAGIRDNRNSQGDART